MSLAEGQLGRDTFRTDRFRLKDLTDQTKKLAFDLTAISTQTTRTLSMPDRDLDLSTPTFDSATILGKVSITGTDEALLDIEQTGGQNARILLDKSKSGAEGATLFSAGNTTSAIVWDSLNSFIFMTNLRETLIGATPESGATTRMTIDKDGNVTLTGELLIPTNLVHSGDLNTYMSFSTDSITFRAGGNGNVVVSSTGISLGDAVGATNYSLFAQATGALSFVGAARINWTKITADNITQGNGTHSGTTGGGGGLVGDIQIAHDGNFYHIDEANADPGFELTVEFVSVVAFNWVNIMGVYDGQASHMVQIALYNFNTTTWDCFGAFDPSGNPEVVTVGSYTLKDKSFFVPDDSDYIGTSGDAGDVRVRIRHTLAGNGNPSDDFDLDVVALYR